MYAIYFSLSITCIILLQAGYVGEDVESLLYNLLMVFSFTIQYNLAMFK